MNDRQLGFFYTIALTLGLTLVLGTSHYLDGDPMSAEDYADKLCQEIYGPQTGHKWVDGKMMCETVRGEIVAVRKL
jgi:hypothetical protein